MEYNELEWPDKPREPLFQTMSHESSGLCWCGPNNHGPELPRDPDNADQPPEVDIHDAARQHPDPQAAAARVLAFVSWFGDGIVSGHLVCPPLYARDLEALATRIVSEG